MDWQTLHESFMELEREERRFGDRDLTSLEAMGSYDDAREYGTWILRNTYNESVRTRFELTATKAALQFAPCPSSMRPWQYWLHRLGSHLRHAGSKYVRVSNGVTHVYAVLEASAMYCADLQREEIERSVMGRINSMVADLKDALRSVEDEGGGMTPEESIPPSTEVVSHRQAVNDFLAKCNAISKQRIGRNHIWRSAGHAKGRQFEYWQAGNADKRTRSDDANFRRIVYETTPEAFIELLRRKKLVTE